MCVCILFKTNASSRSRFASRLLGKARARRRQRGPRVREAGEGHFFKPQERNIIVHACPHPRHYSLHLRRSVHASTV
jgi:hypothetical protein